MVMHDHTRNIAHQSDKLAELEKVYKLTNAKSFSYEPKAFSETIEKIVRVTFRHRRDRDYEEALAETLRVLNKLVNKQRLEAKEDLFTLLKEEVEDTSNADD